MNKTYGELFAGVGGASQGLKVAGYKGAWAIDHNRGALDILEANHDIDRVIHGDVCKVDYSALPEVDLLWASPICTNISGANHNRGETAEDAHLAHAVINAASRAKALIVENVPAYQHTDSFELIANSLPWVNYSEYFSLNAADYGNPSSRPRFYAIFSEKPLAIDGFEICDYLDSHRSKVTWCKALLEHQGRWVESSLTLNQQKAIDADLSRPIPGSIYAIERCGYYKFPSIYNSLSPFPCLKSHPGHDGKNPKPGYGKIGSYRRQYDFVHEGRVYAITPQLMGILMGFPIDYDWGTNRAQAVAGIGNSVVPYLAQIIANLI